MKEEGFDIVVVKFLFVVNGCVFFFNEIDGFMKLIICKEDGFVIGV